MRQEFKLVLVLCGLAFLAGTAALVFYLLNGIPAHMPRQAVTVFRAGNIIAGILYLFTLVTGIVGLRQPELLRVMVPISGIGLMGNLLLTALIVGTDFGLHAIAALLMLTALLSLPRHAEDPTL